MSIRLVFSREKIFGLSGKRVVSKRVYFLLGNIKFVPTSGGYVSQNDHFFIEKKKTYKLSNPSRNYVYIPVLKS